MVEVFDYSKQPIDKVLIATSSGSKRRANEANIETIVAMANLDTPMPVDSMNPEVFEPESDSIEVDKVAWQKTETLRQNLEFPADQRTVLLAFDVATFLGSEEELNAGQGEDLKRVLRQIDLTGDEDVKQKWAKIIDVLETEKMRMIERCTNGAFSIEWHIGFAINSSDSKVGNRGALVLRATFNALSKDVVMQAFALSEKLEEMRAQDILPDQSDLVDGVQALAIGPRLPFAELLPEYAQVDNLTIRDRDYPEDQPQIASTETFLALVRDCALPPFACLQLLADSMVETPSPAAHLAKPTVRLSQVP